MPPVEIPAVIVQNELYAPVALVAPGLFHHEAKVIGNRESMSTGDSHVSQAIQELALGRDLTAEGAENAFVEVMEGGATDVQVAALLMGLRAKGETSEEVAGGVRALRRAMRQVESSDRDALVDTCGTGGGTLTTFNISTAAGFVVAAGGVPVAKHGNRSFSSRCGSADVLEALGVEIALEPPVLSEILGRVGLSFLFAPALHPAMRHVGPVRRELAVPTIMNLLGPLSNPARVRRQVVGVSDPGILTLVAGALSSLGHLRALVVHGEPGLDELSPIGVTDCVWIEDGATEPMRFDPVAELGWTEQDPEGLAGGDPEDNARLIRAVLSGQGPRVARQAVALNAAAGFFVGGVVDSLRDGVERAESVLDERRALEKLEELREATTAAG